MDRRISSRNGRRFACGTANARGAVRRWLKHRRVGMLQAIEPRFDLRQTLFCPLPQAGLRATLHIGLTPINLTHQIHQCSSRQRRRNRPS